MRGRDGDRDRDRDREDMGGGVRGAERAEPEGFVGLGECGARVAGSVGVFGGTEGEQGLWCSRECCAHPDGGRELLAAGWEATC